MSLIIYIIQIPHGLILHIQFDNLIPMFLILISFYFILPFSKWVSSTFFQENLINSSYYDIPTNKLAVDFHRPTTRRYPRIMETFIAFKWSRQSRGKMQSRFVAFDMDGIRHCTGFTVIFSFMDDGGGGSADYVARFPGQQGIRHIHFKMDIKVGYYPVPVIQK